MSQEIQKNKRSQDGGKRTVSQPSKRAQGGVLDQTGTSLTEQQGFRSPAQAQDTPVRAALARREES